MVDVFKAWLTLFILLFPAFSFAQKSTGDHQAWLGVQCKLDFKKGWSLTAQVRGRRINDYSDYYGTYLFLTGDYRINKHWSTFVNYRYSSIVNLGYYHRFAIAVEFQQKVKNFTFSLRPMVQKQNQYFLGDEEHNTPESLLLRPRLQVKFHATKKLDFYLYAEPFIDLNNSQHINWWQNSAAFKYEYSKNKKINFFYIWQPDFSKKHDFTYQIFGIDLEFTIKVGNKDKKGKEKNSDSDTGT
jgi:hypothetical protein